MADEPTSSTPTADAPESCHTSLGSEFFACPADGEIVEFRGCTWSEPEWEFDAPQVLCSPVERYSDSGGSICAEAIYDLVEQVCIDLCCEGKVRRAFSKSDLSEFEWRGWSPKRFKLRKRAVHGVIRIRFFRDTDGMSFELLTQNT